MLLKDGIVELRQKGASLGLIRELVATVDVTVGAATIARFLAEMNDSSTSPRQRRRFGWGRGVVHNADRRRTVAVPTTIASSTASQPATSTPASEPPAERPLCQAAAENQQCWSENCFCEMASVGSLPLDFI
jgi:hypothetical protein